MAGGGGRHRLVGRAAEMATLLETMRDALTERRVCAAVIEGAVGMGTSALAGAVAAEAVAAGATVVRAETVAADDVSAFVADRVASGPVLILAEHLHDADPATIEALLALVTAPLDAPVAVLVTTGDAAHAPGHDVVAAIADAGGEHIVLRPLPEVDWLELARHEVGADVGPTLRRALARAGGVPGGVLALVRALRDEDRVVVRDGVADVESDELPPSLRNGIVSILDGLPQATLDALQVAAALGPVIDIGELALVLGRSVATVITDLAPAEPSRLLASGGSVMWFRYALLGEALHSSLAPALRAALHAEIASVLATAGKAPTDVARHVIAAEGAASAAIAADVAWALRRDAPALAGDVCRTMLGAGVADGSIRDRLVAAWAWPTIVQGRPADAASTVSDVLARPHDGSLDVELTWCLVAALQRLGDAELARDRLVRLLDRPDLDPGDRRWLRVRLPGAHVFAGDLGAAEACAEDLLADPDLRGAPDVALATSTPLVLGRLGRGDVAGAVRVAEGAEWLRRRRRSPAEGVGIIWPMALVEADRFDDARSALRAALRAESDGGDTALLSVYDIWLVVVDVLAGEWEDAVAAADGVWERVNLDGATVSAPWALAYPAVAHLRRNDVERADALVAMAEEVLQSKGPQNGADVVLWARSLVLDARGSTTDAAELLAMEWDLTASARYFLSWRSVAPDLVRLSLAVGDHGRAATVTADAEEGARRAPEAASARGAALRCRGLLDGDPDVLLAAVDALRAGPRRPDTAAAAYDAGVALANAGRRAEAVAALDLARTLAEGIGAWRDLQVVESRLSMLGAAPRRTGPNRHRPATGWESLTARESDVVALVAEGLSNPQIAERLTVSRHTVESHLKRIYLKLDLSSRAQLATAALRRRAASGR